MSDMLNAIAERWALISSQGEVPQILTTQTNPIVMATGGTATTSIELSADAYIQIDDWVAYSSHASFPDELGFRVNIYWGAREWSIMNSGVRGECIFGTAQRPGRIGYRPWAITKPQGGRSLLTFDFTSLNTVTTTVEIYLRGHRRSAWAQR